jgi:hypothetical protein
MPIDRTKLTRKSRRPAGVHAGASFRVFKGSFFYHDYSVSHPENSVGSEPNRRNYVLGFRLARVPVEGN